MTYSHDDIRQAVQERYTRKAAERGSDCCAGGDNECSSAGCGGGYTIEQLQTLPKNADLGLGCGNPTVAAAPREGETVLDLGSGAGVDCFLAAAKVGPAGRVIGVDMTREMVERARENARSGEYRNVEFRLGTIEELPLEDGTVDLIISNCVINLSPEKQRVFEEAYRVLKPGGRLVVSDLVAERTPTEEERSDMDLYCTCVSGAETADVVEGFLETAGFEEMKVDAAGEPFYWGDPDAPVVTVYSATISATKPPTPAAAQSSG